MNALEKLALVKLLGKDLDDAPVGKHHVAGRVTLDLDATISRSPDSEYTPTVSVPLKATLALVLHRAGFQRDRAAEIIVEAMREALTLGEHGADEIAERIADVDAAMERVTEITESLPKQKRKGATRVTGTVAVVEESVPVAA